MVSSPTGLPTIGIVGGGQLARMTVQAAISLGLTVRVLAERPDDSAARISPSVDIGSADDPAALRMFAERCDVVTFDHELVDVDLVRQLEREGHTVYPSASTLALGQDKRLQRERFAALGLPVPPNRLVKSEHDLAQFGSEFGWPIVAKASRGGYDGRGVWVLDDPDAARSLLAETAQLPAPLIAEQRVVIEQEVAVLVARRPSGAIATYPPVETVQANGICREILAPASLDPDLAAQAEQFARDLAAAIDVVGLLALELFVADGRLLVNEIAVRPHNSGHWTIEGSQTSQFEQHLRAILDWPLGDTALTAPSVVTVNVLGSEGEPEPLSQSLPASLAVPGAHVHLYGKATRPGRKLGHVTTVGAAMPETRDRARRAVAHLGATSLVTA